MGKAVRLDKFLADAGAGTRSEVKKYIQKGKVQVNSVPVKKPEIKVSEEDEIILDGNRISKASEFVYYLLHKPAGYVSATEDKRDRTVMELVPSDRKGMFPVGRLDKDTEGLLLITDDGALSHELLSPKKHVDKTYYAVTDGCMTKEDVQRFAEGLEIGEKKTDYACETRNPQYQKSRRDRTGTVSFRLVFGYSAYDQRRQIPSGEANGRSSRKESGLSETNFHGSINIAG